MEVQRAFIGTCLFLVFVFFPFNSVPSGISLEYVIFVPKGKQKWLNLHT